MSIETERQKRRIVREIFTLNKQIKDSQNLIRSAFLNLEDIMRNALDNRELITNEEIVEIYNQIENVYTSTVKLSKEVIPKEIDEYE